MANSNANFSILANVKLDASGVQKQLDDLLSKGGSAGDELSLSFQAANEIFSKSVDIISEMVGQVAELDKSLIEFQKVSDLSGDALDRYISKLSKMGAEVARTGKPNRSEPVCTDGKCA